MELFDETLDINATENYELSIQAGPDGFSFSILDTLRNKIVMIRSFDPDDTKYFNAENIRDFISRDDFLTRTYKKVRLLTTSPKFTLVPSALYDPAKKDEYFTFNHRKEKDEVILANKIKDPDAFLIYSVKSSLFDVLKEFYPGIYPLSHLYTIFCHTSHARKETNPNYIHVHIERDYFNLIIFGHYELKLCNTFSYRNISDIMYFVLNAFNKLEIKQNETIYLSGLAEKYDDLSSNLAIYIKNVRFSEVWGNFTFSYVFNDIEKHRYINLFSVFNCE